MDGPIRLSKNWQRCEICSCEHTRLLYTVRPLTRLACHLKTFQLSMQSIEFETCPSPCKVCTLLESCGPSPHGHCVLEVIFAFSGAFLVTYRLIDYELRLQACSSLAYILCSTIWSSQALLLAVQLHESESWAWAAHPPLLKHTSKQT